MTSGGAFSFPPSETSQADLPQGPGEERAHPKMAARKQLFHPDEVKQKIKTSQLINRLQDNAFAENEFLSRGQIDSIKTLLSKTVPDLKAVEHSGDPDRPVAVMFQWLPPQS
jgi:hypothetical protein